MEDKPLRAVRILGGDVPENAKDGDVILFRDGGKGTDETVLINPRPGLRVVIEFD